MARASVRGKEGKMAFSWPVVPKGGEVASGRKGAVFMWKA